MNNNVIKVFDFFSGCGGTSQGFHQAGMEIVFGLDFDEKAGASFQLNFPNASFINEDISKLDVSCINELVNQSRKDSYILFSGCAPCQPFSRQNQKKNLSDPRRNLLDEFSKFVVNYSPDFIFIENVPGIQKLQNKSSPFFAFIQLIEQLGYNYDYKVVSALWFGVPQNRKRLVLLASKHGEIKLPERINDGGNTPYTTVNDWISELPEISAGESHPTIPDHVSAKLTGINIERIKATPEGGNRRAWPEHLKLNCHKKYSGHSDTYGRLAWDKPSSVLTTRCISYSNGQYGHPTQNRAISIREAALLQTFPLHYQFFGSINDKAKQIGNAVPPLMAQVIGTRLINSIMK